ncbi:hypothetical protein M3E13_03760 [Oceanobacillus kimchii]|uniref:hypothetical protein n=1 Tax=Oceanobacillus kimchii TaxID=746691 RepID=UPI0021A4DB87|nr:hypothetical protein [Oceanobacillus kimchii]MCT1576956.1 hypothetical protein [Oceanobacillus kimchii]MCT2135026.1 hypothetical protein [Oceanobacillus kimchii]
MYWFRKDDYSKNVLISLLIISILLIVQGCDINNEQDIKTASDQVFDLFEEEDGKPMKIKDSTDQAEINLAQEAIDNIEVDSSNDGYDENEAIIFNLQSAITNAQVQLKEREGINTLDQPENKKQNKGEHVKEVFGDYETRNNDVVFSNNQLRNKDILDEFMKAAGEKGEKNESEIKEIRVVKEDGSNGILVYDLVSRYDEVADQRWIDVMPDLSNFIAPENEPRDVFNIRQQCGYMTRNEETGYYVLRECTTHWEYPLFPVTNNEG